MFVKRFLHKAGAVDTPAIPAGGLRASHLQPQLAVHHGIFHSASILAYEPVQRLLAVASNDGRVKLLGANGIQALLQSPWQLACKYLEFMNNRGFLVQVNTRNHIEVWDFGTKELLCHQSWDGDITSFYVLQGSPFILVGEHSGLVVVLQYVEEEQLLKRMSYGIPAHITLGGLVRAGSNDVPCVVATLAQPDVLYSRLLIAYGNGLIVLWGLYENQVLAVRGGTENQRHELSNFANSLKGRALVAAFCPSQNDEEEKEVCCMCWVCPVGSVVAVGYTDGEILLWSLPTIIKAKGQMDMELVEGLPYSGEPFKTVDLAPGKAKMPVVGLTWCASGNSIRGAGGRLYVFGGGEVGRPEALMVISLDTLNSEGGGAKLLQWDLTLQGAFADMALLPPWPAGDGLCTPAAALALLMSPGLLHVYDELSIASYFASLTEGMPSPPPPQPVPLQLHVTETNVTCAKLVLVSNDGVAAKTLLQIPPISKSSVPFTLPAGTKWPISGGKHISIGSSPSGDVLENSIYLTGHGDGLVSFWDASSPSYNLICRVKSQSKLGSDCSVSALEFCASSGLLAVGDELGMVFVYRLQKESNEVNCCIVGRGIANNQEELQQSDGIFGCFLILQLHEAPIRSIALASGLSRLAVGDENGKVSIVDLQSNTVIPNDNCFSHLPSSISYLAFSAEAASTSIPLSPTSSSPRITSQQDQASHVSILYVVGKDANMVAYDGSTGSVIAQGAHSSTPVSLHLLDADGAPISLLSAPSNKAVQTDAENTGSAEDMLSSGEETSSNISWTHSEAQFLLLCCTDSLRLYATSAIIQGQRVTLKKVKLEKKCCWTSAFQEKSKESGLIVLYTNGDMEFRSLPDLECVKETSLSICLNWKIEPDELVMKSLGCSINGRLILIDHGREVVQISCLEEDTNRVKLLPQPQLYDRDVALADAHASAARNIPKKKVSIPGMEGLLKGVVGGVIKELKNALDPEVQCVHLASELPKLFSTRPYTIASPQSSRSKTGGEVSSSDNLDIDDIDVDDVRTGPPAAAEPSSGGGFGKFRWSLKGKEKTSREPESDRMKLFDGNDAPPKQPTVDDIRAKYGHQRKSQEVSSVMEMARNKLMERGEKLQGIENRTSELEDNAENFASMAEELAKRMAAKKWWEL